MPVFPYEFHKQNSFAYLVKKKKAQNPVTDLIGSFLKTISVATNVEKLDFSTHLYLLRNIKPTVHSKVQWM